MGLQQSRGSGEAKASDESRRSRVSLTNLLTLSVTRAIECAHE